MAVEVTLTKCLLRDRRRAADLTQDQLAKILGINKARISEYERMERFMTYITAVKISHALKCELGELYEWSVADEDE